VSLETIFLEYLFSKIEWVGRQTRESFDYISRVVVSLNVMKPTSKNPFQGNISLFPPFFVVAGAEEEVKIFFEAAKHRGCFESRSSNSNFSFPPHERRPSFYFQSTDIPAVPTYGGTSRDSQQISRNR